MIQKTLEEYIECIYALGGADNLVHTSDIAACMSIAPASVTEMLQKLSRNGYVKYERYKGVILTKKGLKIAEELQHRHKTLQDFFVTIGLDKENADREACTLEHVADPNTIQVLMRFMEFLKRCDEKPFWLNLFHDYLKNGELKPCPPELQELCKKYREKYRGK